ncbi:MAG TPA: co-chaperone GroES [Candidatus Brocadiia bacterium]|nr:co-chaperone GroES [Planctomycetota bacterium]MBI4007732.1 co-chaperone GroES [Planctomycetota bacterium]MDO8092919.1 co-chaperone GroES [Candidatus Brocadiales bacterium]
MPTIRPLDDRVVIERVEAEEKTQGGIVLPDTAKEKPARGRVVAVGEGRLLESGKRAPIDLKKGDNILFGKYAGSEVTVDGKEYLIMRESDILAKIV